MRRDRLAEPARQLALARGVFDDGDLDGRVKAVAVDPLAHLEVGGLEGGGVLALDHGGCDGGEGVGVDDGPGVAELVGLIFLSFFFFVSVFGFFSF